MNPILGHIIVITVLLIVVFFAGRATIKELRAELNGKPCSQCGGSCSGSCSSCNVSTEELNKLLEKIRKEKENA
ncbi:MAG: FeoB-associated Cys-rich membrane protein [Eubacterium sp.]|nr:FeoB-associated Cys-rich membrane protein [Eubacterium sp.]